MHNAFTTLNDIKTQTSLTVAFSNKVKQIENKTKLIAGA